MVSEQKSIMKSFVVYCFVKVLNENVGISTLAATGVTELLGELVGTT
jgi:hypothetical protein